MIRHLDRLWYRFLALVYGWVSRANLRYQRREQIRRFRKHLEFEHRKEAGDEIL